jgi:sugar/nucleoside kinase (ribokinase family)
MLGNAISAAGPASMSQYDVLCIGNAIVDIIAQCDEAFLVDNGIIKGAMNLIDAERAELLYSRMGPAIEASGGSAGNTAAGVASFGGKAAYFGKVANDQLGEIFIATTSAPRACLRHAAAGRHRRRRRAR